MFSACRQVRARKTISQTFQSSLHPALLRGIRVAPADLGFVTPVSTVAVQMASAAAGYLPELGEEKVGELVAVLADPTLVLAADALTNMQLIRLNAQLQQVLSAFSGERFTGGHSLSFQPGVTLRL